MGLARQPIARQQPPIGLWTCSWQRSQCVGFRYGLSRTCWKSSICSQFTVQLFTSLSYHYSQLALVSLSVSQSKTNRGLTSLTSGWFSGFLVRSKNKKEKKKACDNLPTLVCNPASAPTPQLQAQGATLPQEKTSTGEAVMDVDGCISRTLSCWSLEDLIESHNTMLDFPSTCSDRGNFSLAIVAPPLNVDLFKK